MLTFSFFLFFNLVPRYQPEAEDSEDQSDSDIEIVFEQRPNKEQAELAQKLMLPPTFFLYKNEPGYVSDTETDGEVLLLESLSKNKTFPSFSLVYS